MDLEKKDPTCFLVVQIGIELVVVVVVVVSLHLSHLRIWKGFLFFLVTLSFRASNI